MFRTLHQYKPLALFAALANAILVVTVFDHTGDLQYYLVQRDGTIRNGIVGNLLLPIYKIIENEQAITFVWALAVTGAIYSARRYISFQMCAYIALVAPFILIPSKESVVALMLCAIGVPFFKNIRVRHLIFIVAILLRPQYSVILSILLFSKLSYKFLCVASTLLLLGTTTIIFITESAFEELLKIWLAYVNGYFIFDSNAGSTDYGFLANFDLQDPIEKNIVEIGFRALLPIWIMNIDSKLAPFYAVYYIIIISYSTWLLKAHFHLRGRMELLTAYVGIAILAILPAAPLLVTNAGSTIRYLSVLPILIYLMRVRSRCNKVQCS
jgi:hypothetical protein